MRWQILFSCVVLAIGTCLAAGSGQGEYKPAEELRIRPDYKPNPTPTRYLTTPPGRHPVAVFKMLVERGNFRDSVEIAELTQEYGKVPPHVHRSDEIFHVLEGELIITVKRKGDTEFQEVCLKPGMTGTIARGDFTTHEVVTDHMRAIVVWAPGGEADHMTRLAFRSTPYEEGVENPYHELVKINKQE